MTMPFSFAELFGPMYQHAMPYKRLRLFKVLKWGIDSDSEEWHEDREEVTSLDDANIVSSQFRGSDHHMVILDLDVPAALVPSSTPGHSHLYIQSRMGWETYSNLLDALSAAGILEPGYVGASKARKFTGVRLPWISK